MFEELIRRWWIVAARGAVSIALGFALFAARVEALWILVSMFGLFALADGIFAAGAGLAVGWLAVFLEGVVGMTVGVFHTNFFPGAVQLWFVPLVVAWAVITGVLAVLGAVHLGRRAQGGAVIGQWILALHGAISVAFGTVFAFRPDLGALTGILGAYAIVSGALLFVLALNLRTWPRAAASRVAA